MKTKVTTNSISAVRMFARKLKSRRSRFIFFSADGLNIVLLTPFSWEQFLGSDAMFVVVVDTEFPLSILVSAESPLPLSLLLEGDMFEELF